LPVLTRHHQQRWISDFAVDIHKTYLQQNCKFSIKFFYRGEWVANRVVVALEKVGLTENKMYNMAALKGRPGFHEYLKTSISDLKVNFAPKLTNQDLKLINCVIELIVQYFTFDGTTNADEEYFNFDEDDENVDKEENSTEIKDNSAPVR
jgi:hypothetical protein